MDFSKLDLSKKPGTVDTDEQQSPPVEQPAGTKKRLRLNVPKSPSPNGTSSPVSKEASSPVERPVEQPVENVEKSADRGAQQPQSLGSRGVSTGGQKVSTGSNTPVDKGVDKSMERAAAPGERDQQAQRSPREKASAPGEGVTKRLSLNPKVVDRKAAPETQHSDTPASSRGTAKKSTPILPTDDVSKASDNLSKPHTRAKKSVERGSQGSVTQHTPLPKWKSIPRIDPATREKQQSQSASDKKVSPSVDTVSPDQSSLQQPVSTPVEKQTISSINNTYSNDIVNPFTEDEDVDVIDPNAVTADVPLDEEDTSAPFTGFDDLLEDLLEDEPVPTQGDTSIESGGVADTAEDVIAQAGERYRARDAFPEEYAKRADYRERIADARQRGYEKFQEDVEAWKQEQGIVGEAPKERSDVHVKFARQYDARPVADVQLDAQGVPVDYAQRVASKEQSSRYRYFSKDRRMNTAEMRFFRETQLVKSEAMKSTELAEQLLPPVGKRESEKEFRARARRITQVLEGKAAYQKGARSTFGMKEQDTLQFLAMFRYATTSHIGRMFSEAYSTTVKRLQKLRSYGLVIDKAIFGTDALWVLTDAGMLLSGMDLVRTTDSRLTFSMFPHQFTVNNTAAHLWGAGVNVLGLADYPQYNKKDLKGNPIPGEQLVSELQIQSSFTKQRAFGAAHIFRPQIIGQINTAFDKWEEAGGVEFGPSPEMQPGNEYMWTLLPPTMHRHAYHVPDLVVQRERNPDGSPNSIAVEIEIYNKPQESYDRTLRAYAAEERIYASVIWVCKGVGSARKLEKAAQKTGLKQSGRISIVPILTEDGVFRGRDLWLI